MPAAKKTTAAKLPTRTAAKKTAAPARKVAAAPVVQEIVVPMVFDRDTKGTHVFAGAEEETVIRSLYVNKGAFGGAAWEDVEIVIRRRS